MALSPALFERTSGREFCTRLDAVQYPHQPHAQLSLEDVRWTVLARQRLLPIAL